MKIFKNIAYSLVALISLSLISVGAYAGGISIRIGGFGYSHHHGYHSYGYPTYYSPVYYQPRAPIVAYRHHYKPYHGYRHHSYFRDHHRRNYGYPYQLYYGGHHRSYGYSSYDDRHDNDHHTGHTGHAGHGRNKVAYIRNHE